MARFFLFEDKHAQVFCSDRSKKFATVLVSYTTSKNSQRAQLSVIANRKKKLILIFFLDLPFRESNPCLASEATDPNR